MKRFLINTTVTGAEGSQTWYVDAETESEALEKYEKGGSDIYASDVEVASLGEPEIEGETSLDDFGDFNAPPPRQPLTDAVIEAARKAMDESFEAGNDAMDICIPAHLAAALSLCLDEYEAAHGIKGEQS